MQLVRTFLYTARIRIPTMNHAAHSLVTKLIAQSWLPVVEKGYMCLVIVS